MRFHIICKIRSINNGGSICAGIGSGPPIHPSRLFVWPQISKTQHLAPVYFVNHGSGSVRVLRACPSPSPGCGCSVAFWRRSDIHIIFHFGFAKNVIEPIILEMLMIYGACVRQWLGEMAHHQRRRRWRLSPLIPLSSMFVEQPRSVPRINTRTCSSNMPKRIGGPEPEDKRSCGLCGWWLVTGSDGDGFGSVYGDGKVWIKQKQTAHKSLSWDI